MAYKRASALARALVEARAFGSLSCLSGRPWRCGRCRASHPPLRASASAEAASQPQWGDAERRQSAGPFAAELLQSRTEAHALQDLRRREAHLPPGPLRGRAAAAFDMAALDAALSANRTAECLAHVRALAAALDAPGAGLAPGDWGRPVTGGARPPPVAAVSLKRQRGAQGPSGAPSSAARQYIGEVFRGRHTARPRPAPSAFPPGAAALFVEEAAQRGQVPRPCCCRVTPPP